MKSDDVNGRTRMYKNICRWRPPHGARDAGIILMFWLRRSVHSVSLLNWKTSKSVGFGDLSNERFVKPVKESGQSADFDRIRIGLASPEEIRSWSFGEVKSLKQLIIGPSSQNETGYSARVFLAR